MKSDGRFGFSRSTIGKINCGCWRKSDERFEFSGSNLVKIYLCYLKYQFI